MNLRYQPTLVRTNSATEVMTSSRSEFKMVYQFNDKHTSHNISLKGSTEVFVLERSDTLICFYEKKNIQLSLLKTLDYHTVIIIP